MKIPQPFTIRKESTTQDNQQYGEERDNRAAILRAAQRLNRITVGGVFIAVLSVGAIYLTLRQSQTSMRIDQRAWLGIKGVNFATVYGAFGASAQLENTGKTPAVNVKIHERIDELPPFMPPSFPEDFTYSAFKAPEIFGPVAPGASPNTRYGETNTTGLIPLMKDAQVLAFFHGRAVYDDVFGYHHWLVFCFYSQKKPTVDIVAGWQPCAANNQIDEEMQ